MTVPDPNPKDPVSMKKYFIKARLRVMKDELRDAEKTYRKLTELQDKSSKPSSYEELLNSCNSLIEQIKDEMEELLYGRI